MGGSPISSTQQLQRTEDMTPITRQDILSHQTVVPWAAQYQIEQDLLLCRAMVALFEDRFLHGVARSLPEARRSEKATSHPTPGVYRDPCPIRNRSQHHRACRVSGDR